GQQVVDGAAPFGLLDDGAQPISLSRVETAACTRTVWKCGRTPATPMRPRMSMVKAPSNSMPEYEKPSSLAVRLKVTDSQPHSAPSTACSGEGPSPVPPCGIGSSVTKRPDSPQSMTVFM